MKVADEVVVLAGGLGTRLRSVVSDLPKPLAPVAGRPFLAWLLDELVAQGARRIILATGYMAGTVEQVIGSQWQGKTVLHSVEDTPLGTGGAVCQALQHLQGDAVHVCNGDTFLRYSLMQLQQHTEADGSLAGIALARVDDVARYGAVQMEGSKISAFAEKGGTGPGYINAGSYYFSRDGLQQLQQLHRQQSAFSLESAFLQPLAASGRVSALLETSGFIDIGVPTDYGHAQSVFGQ